MITDPMDRRARLLAHCNHDTECGLEIGPLDNALVLRQAGRRIFYCDYATREELQRRSASDPNVNTLAIPEIDFVTSRISETTFGSSRFDFVIASHVIEHVPDLISWLRNLISVLNEGGRIILAIPDKRYTFDYTRQLTTSGELIEAYLEKRSRPTASQIYDGFSQATYVDSELAWTTKLVADDLVFRYSRLFAFGLAKDSIDNTSYHDCHCWVFTYDSFLLLMQELESLGVLDACVVAHSAPVPGSNEFHVVLGHGSRPGPAIRYEGMVIVQPPSNRGKEDGWYLVKGGRRHWIIDAAWLSENGYHGTAIVEISSEDFYGISEGLPIA